MPTLTWIDALELKHAQMDDTHREFVQLLGALETALAAESATLARHLSDFVAHTEAHFAQEDRWMATLGFAPENCHAFQHKHVLQVLHEVQQRLAADGELKILRALVPELIAWFPQHAQMMDAALAETMQLAGYDVATDTMRNPPQPAGEAAKAAATSCGASACG